MTNLYRVRQHNFLFLNSRHSVGGCRSGAPVVSYEIRDYKVSYRHSSVAIMSWNSEERAFAVEAYFSSGCSVRNPARLSESRFGVTGPLSRFDPLWFFSMGFFEIPCLCKPSKNPTRFEDQYPGRNCQHSACYAVRSHDKRQNRFTQCMENGGRHLPDVIFKTN